MDEELEEKIELNMHISKNKLVVSFPGEVEDEMLNRAQKEILNKVKSHDARGVILDLSCIKIMDAYMFRLIKNTGKMLKLMGKKVVISGLRPEVASSLSALGYHAGDIFTAVDIEHGHKIIEQDGNINE